MSTRRPIPRWALVASALAVAGIIAFATRPPARVDLHRIDQQVRSLKVAGRLDEAERLVRRELDAARAEGVTGEPLGVLESLHGDVLLFLGRFDESEAALRVALRDTEAAGGVSYGIALHDLGALRLRQNAADEAEGLLRRALAVKEAARPLDEGSIAETLDVLGQALTHLHRAGEAEPLQRRAVELFSKDSTLAADLAVAVASLGATRMELGRLEEANADLARALALQERIHGPVHPTTASTLQLLAACAYRGGHAEEAATFLRRAVEVYARTLAPDHPDLTFARGELESVERELSRRRPLTP